MNPLPGLGYVRTFFPPSSFLPRTWVTYNKPIRFRDFRDFGVYLFLPFFVPLQKTVTVSTPINPESADPLLQVLTPMRPFPEVCPYPSTPVCNASALFVATLEPCGSLRSEALGGH